MDEQVSQGIKKAIFAENSKYKNNVFFMQSEPITYRGISMVLNTINAMKVLLEREEHWDYFINISGSDYPLASPLLQRRLLGRHVKNAFNFMTYSPPEKWGKNAEYRMDNFYVDETLGFKDHGSNIQQLKQINPLAKSLNVEYTNAEAWMINSRDFCQFVVTSGYARKMLLTFAYSADSAEHYFSTLLWNHPVYNRTIVSHAMRQVVWFHEGHEAGQHPFNVDEVDSNGSFIFQKVIKESPNFFVRKFKKNDSAMMDWIDERLNLKERVRKITNHYEWATSKARAENGSKEKVIIED